MTQKKEYSVSQKVRDAEAAVAAQKETRPEYQSGWDSQIKALMDRILNREEFHYDLNGDALYRQYHDRAVRDGRRAMADAAGQAAALTGGYGNSYAQSVGQQAYQHQMEQLGDRIPELYGLALDQYRQESQLLQQKYDLASGAERQDYARYLDSLAAWQKEADSLWKTYVDARDYDYGIYRDEIADWKWQQDYDESLRRYNQQWAADHPAVSAEPEPVYSTAAVKKQTQTKQEQKKPMGFVASVQSLGKSGVKSPVLQTAAQSLVRK